MSFAVPMIPAFDDGAAARARAHQQTLTKPPGSLGRLEELAVFYAGARGAFPAPPVERARLCVFAADHGVTAEGVSPYPPSVTAAMVANFLAGGAAISVLARACGVELVVADVGVATPLPPAPVGGSARLVRAPVRAGTDNFRLRPAMSRPEAEAALDVGARLAEEAARD